MIIEAIDVLLPEPVTPAKRIKPWAESATSPKISGRYSFSKGRMFEVINRAAEALLSSGEFGTSSRGDLYSSVVAFRARTEVYRDNVALFIELRETLINYLSTVAPVAFLTAGPETHGPTDFPIPVDDLLQDRQLEGLVGSLAIRIRNVNALAQELIARADSIRVLVASDGAT